MRTGQPVLGSSGLGKEGGCAGREGWAPHKPSCREGWTGRALGAGGARVGGTEHHGRRLRYLSVNVFPLRRPSTEQPCMLRSGPQVSATVIIAEDKSSRGQESGPPALDLQCLRHSDHSTDLPNPGPVQTWSKSARGPCSARPGHPSPVPCAGMCQKVAGCLRGCRGVPVGTWWPTSRSQSSEI